MNTRDLLKALLQDELVLEAVIHGSTPYAGRFNWRRGDGADALVVALAKAGCLRKAHAVACAAAGALAVVRALTWPAQARSLRHAMYSEGTLIPKRRQTAEDRQQANARKWGFIS